MKLLAKREIDKAKAQEKKQEIDTGLSLAKAVDTLREQLQTEQKSLLVWRETHIQEVKDEIAQIVAKKDILDKECDEARILREELLKPLDKEWQEINLEKQKLSEEKSTQFIAREQLDLNIKKIKDDTIKISQILARARYKENETEKAKQESFSLRDMAQKEYEIARMEHISQIDTNEKKMRDIKSLEESYQNGININEIEKKRLQEIESELIIREKDLNRQQALLRITSEAIKNNGNSMSTDNKC